MLEIANDVNVQHLLGKLLDSIGAISAALEVYMRLQLWEDVITCHAKLGHQQKVRTGSCIFLIRFFWV